MGTNLEVWRTDNENQIDGCFAAVSLCGSCIAVACCKRRQRRIFFRSRTTSCSGHYNERAALHQGVLESPGSPATAWRIERWRTQSAFENASENETSWSN